MSVPRHPAKYSNALLPVLAAEIGDCARVLDPFAGTGKLRVVRPDAYLLEIEPEWADCAGAVVGSALSIPWGDGYFDCVCTSPCYGNRMADHHEAKDASRRNTYRHSLGRKLSEGSSGSLQWGKEYRKFHFLAWGEVRRVLGNDGLLILNISDHIRKGKVVKVARFHRLLLQFMGFEYLRCTTVSTPRQRYGRNGEARVDGELVMVFRKKCGGK